MRSRVSTKRLLRDIRRLDGDLAGWEVERRQSGHLMCRHPLAARAVFCSGTPSDHHSWENLLAELRRALREGPPKAA